MHIALPSDANFFRGLAMAVCSILQNSTEIETKHFHVLDGGLTNRQKKWLHQIVGIRSESSDITFHKVALEEFDGFRLMRGNSLTYARLLLPYFLPNLDEVIYGDTDIYYGADLAPIWQYPIENSSALVVRDSKVGILGEDCEWLEKQSSEYQACYFNAGFMKINLSFWREHRVAERALEMARTEPDKYRFWDQTILNLLLKDSVSWIDAKFNYMVHEENQVDTGSDLPEGKNLHYIFRIKPWMRHSQLPSFRYWREKYRQLISPWPVYKLNYRYWAEYFWANYIIKSPLRPLICKLLLSTGLHRILPGLNEEKLQSHLRN